LASNRWYASAQTLANGKVFVAAGSLNGRDPINLSNNNPTYEILNSDGVSQGRNIRMSILAKNQPYWMYPFLHLLSDGSLFIFVDKSSEIFNVDKNTTVKTMPDLPGLHRTYPNSGGSVMLPLRKANNYQSEIMICGGGQYQGIDSPCDSTCGRLKPLSRNPQWTITKMPEGRVMVEGVLLLDGTVLWINGAKIGAQGFGIADSPATEAVIYDPMEDIWRKMGHANFPRLYHSVALLLLDGTVLIARSNPNEMPLHRDEIVLTSQSKKFCTEFNTEVWVPPYLRKGLSKVRPVVERLDPKNIDAQTKLYIQFSTAKEVGLEEVEIILHSNGFVTHSVHMGQVMVYLEKSGWKGQRCQKCQLIASVPGNVKLAPGPYVIYVVVNSIPAMGRFITWRV
jgi:hypothetical protein